jgi:septal ring-binding cell division protein DamX
MEAPALREVARERERTTERERESERIWKDKIEVRLDNRQVFFLFFGSAMVACMLFVLGVIVGKRLESRGRAETTTTVDDPLAVLDRLGPPGTPGRGPSSGAGAPAPVAHAALTFPKTLIGGATPSGRNKVASATRDERAASARAARPTLTATGPGVGPARMVVAVTETPEPESFRTGAAGPPATKPPVAGKPPATVKPPVTAKPAIAARPAVALSSPSRRTQSTAVAADGTVEVAGTAPLPLDKESKPRGHFLLQLSSFQDRTEAEAFARRFPGQNAYIVTSELPGKGTWYRVRVGDFGTMQEASVAKTAFERAHNVIAYVAGTGPAH